MRFVRFCDNLYREVIVMIGDRIKDLRLAQNLTQGQLSSDIGININTLASYERNLREPKAETMIQLAEYFKVSTDYLFGISPYKNYNKKNDITGDFQKFLFLFREYDPTVQEAFIFNVGKLLIIEDLPARNYIIRNINSLICLHHKIYDNYTRYRKLADKFANTAENPVHINTELQESKMWDGISEEAILYFVQNNFNPTCFEESKHIYDETNAMIESLFSLICSRNGLSKKFNNSFKFNTPAVRSCSILDTEKFFQENPTPAPCEASEELVEV